MQTGDVIRADRPGDAGALCEVFGPFVRGGVGHEFDQRRDEGVRELRMDGQRSWIELPESLI